MTTTKLTDYLDLENLLTSRIQQEQQEIVHGIWPEFERALNAGDFAKATAIAEGLSLASVGPAIKYFAYTLMKGTIEFGASLAATGNTLITHLELDRTVNASVNQLCAYMEYGATLQLQKYLLQSIALKRQQLLQKAEALRDFVSFKDQSDGMARMISGLHTSRLSGWGFTAEAEMLGLTTYKLSAQLDNRTSKFCRFIHGKTFTVESAKRVLDQAVYADDPDSLKSIHPWPDQSKAGMGDIQAMSHANLQANGFGVPPFHPGCRTLMVRVGYKSRMIKPPTDVGQFPEYLSTPQTFMDLGINFSQEKVHTWNDYMRINPASVLSLLTGKKTTELLGTATDMIKISAKGEILFEWDTYKLQYLSGTGSILLSNPLSREMVARRKFSELGVFAKAIGADDIQMLVAPGDALALGMSGVVPDAGAWTDVKASLAEKLAAISVSAGLSQAQQTGVQAILSSANPSRFSDLFSLDLPQDVLDSLLSQLGFRGVYYLDTTGLTT